MRLEREYYVLSIDKSDPPFFWPIVLHELSHCWLSSRDDVDRICGRHLSDLRRIDREIAERRVEESLCDALATHLIGPSYPYAYLNKLWARFPVHVSITYPSHKFRVECMATVLDRMDCFQAGADLRNVSDGVFNGSWDDEEISWALDEIVDVTSELPLLVGEDVVQRASRSLSMLDISPPDDLPTLFLACWMLIDSSDLGSIYHTVDNASRSVLTVLGRTKPTNPHS